jgi:Dockerin type I domain
MTRARRLSLAHRPAQRKPDHRASSRRLFVEPLEDRRLLATITGTFAGGVLSFAGDAGANELQISAAGNIYTLTSATDNINIPVPNGLVLVGNNTPLLTVDVSGAAVTQLAIDLADGGDTLTLNAVSGTAATALTALNVTDAAGASDTVSVNGAINIGGTLTIGNTLETTTLANNVTTTGDQIYNGSVTLGANVVLVASTVTFNSTVAGGGNSLGITGNAVFGDAAADTVTGLSTLSVSGTTTINTNTVTTTGTQTYSGAATIGAIAGTATLSTTDSAVLFGNTTTLASNLTVNAGAGNITFTGAVDGGFALVANSTGTTTFGAAVGVGVNLASVTTNAGGTTAINGGAVRTTGAQTYNDNVTLGAGTVIAASTVTFNGTLAGGGNSLGITSNAVFGNEAADTVTGLSTLSVSGTTTINTNTVTTTGTQTYSGDVTIGTTTILTASTVTLNGKVTGSGQGLRIIGNAILGDAAGDNITGLNGLRIDGTTTINTDTITTISNQNYIGAVTLGTGTTLTGLTVFLGGVIGGNNSLAVSGNAVLLNPVTGLTTLQVSGTTAINTNTVTTTGTQTYSGAVSIGAAALSAILTTTNSAVLFGSTITLASNLTVNAGAGNITFTEAVDGGFALVANSTGTTTFGAAVGNGVNLASVTTNAGGTTAINGGIVKTTGAQTYNDNVTLGAGTVIAASTVTFNGTVVGGGNSLGITGNAVFGDAAADTVTGVSTLSVSGTTTINANTVTTTGTQTYTGAATIGATAGTAVLTTTDSAVLFGSTTTLASNLTVNAGAGNITFTGTVNGGFTLVANSTGTTTFTAAVGVGVNLASVTTNPGGTTAINGGAVRTTGAQTYNDNVTLGANTTLTASSVTFAGTVNADNAVTNDRTLTVNAAGGTVTFGGNVGSTQALADLDVTATTINLNTATIQVEDQGGNTVTFTGAVVLGANVTVDTDGATDNNVTFTGTINADNAAANDLTLTVTAGTGTVTFGGNVGTTQALADLDVTAATINLNATTYQVDDSNAAAQTITLNGSVLLGANVAIDGDRAAGVDNSVSLTGSVNADAEANNRTLQMTAGPVTIDAAVGQVQKLFTLTVTASGPIDVHENVSTNSHIQLTANETPVANTPDTSNVTITAGDTVASTGGDVTITAEDNITVLGGVTAIGHIINFTSNDSVDSPAAGPSGVTGTVFTLTGTLNAAQINVTGSAANDVMNMAFARIKGPVTVRGGMNDATLAPGVIRDTVAAEVPAITKFSKSPFFLPTVKTFVVGDQIFIDDNGATPVDNFNRDYTLDGIQIRRVGDAAPFITFPDHDLELLKLTTGRGNNDVTANLATGGTLPNIVQVDTVGVQIGAADDRFQVLGTAGDDKISIGDIDLHPSLNSPALGPIRAHFELKGVQRLWVQSFAGDDVIDNISSVPGLLDGGAGKDAINSIVNHASSFKLAKKIENSVPKNVTLVLGNEDADKLYVGTGFVDNGVAVTPLITALRNFPDLGITFLIGDHSVVADKLTAVALNKQPGDNYASSATFLQHGFIALKDFNDPAPALNSSLGNFRFGAGDKVKFSKTIAWLKAQLFVGAAVPLLLKSLNTQVAEYTRPVTDAAGEGSLLMLADGETSSMPVLDARIDVNRDGYISPADALSIINELNARGSRKLPALDIGEGEYSLDEESPLNLDVNDDSHLSPLDALLVINALNILDQPDDTSAAAADEFMEENYLEENADEVLMTTMDAPATTNLPSAEELNAEALWSLLASDTQAAQRRRQAAAAALI